MTTYTLTCRPVQSVNAVTVCIYFFLVITGVLLTCSTHAQTLPAKVEIMTPEVAAFNRNIETPVSLYSGVPNISIPLYEITVKGVTVPITLDYHAGGIRVDQEATWVGLGWALNYGGQITRTVKNVADEKFYLPAGTSSNLSINHYLNLPTIQEEHDMLQRLDYITAAKMGTYLDYMPDEYHFSALGNSGKFMFSQEQNKFILFPRQDITVERDWKIKLPDGVQVEFGRDAKVSTTNSNGIGNTVNSWQIKAIKTPYKDSIVYSYTPFTYSTFKIFGQTYTHADDEIQGSTSAGYSHYQDVRLTSISFPTGRVDFIGESRSDMGGQALSRIEVYNQYNQLIRKIKFQYTYFVGSGFDALDIIGYDDQFEYQDDLRYYRLKLDEITIEGASPTDFKKYVFDYYTDVSSQMPSKYSFSQDHWGYFNGIAANSTTMFGSVPNMDPQYFTGGDRRVKPDKAKMFSLKTITYPEGGKSEFIYENNTCGQWNIPRFLLNMYDDDNLIEKSYGISISSHSRKTSNPAYSQIVSDTRYFRRRFTIPLDAYLHLGFGWDVSTTFGLDASETSMSYFTNNVNFKLERIADDSSRTVIREFNTTQLQSPYARTGVDKSILGILGGRYELTVAITYSSPTDINIPYNLFVNVRWREMNPAKKMLYVGGLRVKEIKHYASDNVLAKKMEYRYVNPNTGNGVTDFTSGRTLILPNYYQFKMQNASNQSSTFDWDWYWVFNSNSVHPLETTAGSYAGYEYVDEIMVDYTNPANNLRTNHRFSFQAPYYSQYYRYMNLSNWEPAEWLRGKSLHKKVYKGNTVIHQEDYTYYDWSPHLAEQHDEDYVQEIRTDYISHQYLKRNNPYYPAPPDFVDYFDNIGNPEFFESIRNQQPCMFWYYGADDYATQTHFIIYNNNGVPIDTLETVGDFCKAEVHLPYFKHYTGFDKLKTKVVTTTDDAGNTLVQTENYFFEKTPNLYQVTRTEQTGNRGELIKQLTKYPLDYPATAPYATMLQRHIKGIPIEQASYRGANFLSSSTTGYHHWANDIIAVDTVQTKQGTNPTEIRARVLSYDARGNVTAQLLQNNIVHVYLWGYNDAYPVAEVAGADLATVQSFINQTILTNASGTYTEQQIRNELNKIRTGLAGTSATITTYTYKPLTGITSVTDPNNRTSYYEYDSLGRLQIVKDHDGNIVKTFEYHYKNQN